MSQPDSQPLPKLRLVPPDSPEELAHRFEREKRAVALQREDQLGQPEKAFRIGSVPFLNAAPLVRGLEEQIVYAVPSTLAEMLRNDHLDAALLSVTEALLNEGYDILDGVAIASLGEVVSVLLAHCKPLGEMREVYCDAASLASVNLLKVLLAEQNLHPEFKRLDHYDFSRLPDYALLIGDPAIDFIRSPHSHEIWDLGTAWYELTRLPFVFAVWVLRRRSDNAALRRQLRDAQDFGLDTLDSIIQSRTDYDLNFRRDYLSWHVHYHLGSDEKRGLARFIELLRKHGLGPVFEPRFVA